MPLNPPRLSFASLCFASLRFLLSVLTLSSWADFSQARPRACVREKARRFWRRLLAFLLSFITEDIDTCFKNNYNRVKTIDLPTITLLLPILNPPRLFMLLGRRLSALCCSPIKWAWGRHAVWLLAVSSQLCVPAVLLWHHICATCRVGRGSHDMHVPECCVLR